MNIIKSAGLYLVLAGLRIKLVAMDLRQEKIKRENFLVALWELHAGNYGHDVSTKEACQRIGIDYDTEGSIVGQYLYRAGLVKWGSFEWICLTPDGIKEVERIVESRYAEQEDRVLRRIYDMGGVRHMDEVMIDDLVKELRMEYREVNRILIELEERKGLIDADEVSVKMNPVGMEYIEGGGRRAASAAPNITYQTNIHGSNYGGIQQGGRGNVQNIMLTNNPDFDKALASLIEMIRSSSIPDDDKQEIQDELAKVNKLALREPALGLLDRARSRLEVVKLALTGTDIAIKAAPHIKTLWDLIEAKFGGA